MHRPYDIITFDCYGTLVDWEGGISRAFMEAAAEDGVRLGREEILAAHREVEPRVQSEGFRTYRDVLTETAKRMAHGFGWAIDHPRARFLAESLPGWRVFEDTNEALSRLHDAGYRLGILSNVDDDLLCGTMRQFDCGFELVVTAQQVHSYKPAPAHFVVAREKIGGDRWLHAAQSWFHDIVPATALGIPNAWVNRNGDAPGENGKPDHEVGDLAGLADRLC
ncbi:MAG: HAD-IA family hydrolase [Acidobacteria bacterium]|nr:HAD-IA family hydrolase [Acidobacteriota bacterium]NIM62298.1 HAD-IA family hydrolase [Acidobacteriota bacterium]NIO58239.1 HAD-IA family hydrolase [Acidobacteriota bacterium]NIQ29268.1 HAD-IA family hydrolase [Acidobacteriota bacterium]NIQ83867.1 HAD-IA family hydrolase [Acidobacteriota bacterium]